MATLLKLGPKDHGRRLSLEEFEQSDYQEGFKYELIKGRLAVSPTANLPEDDIVQWISDVLKAYARAHPEVINYVSPRGRVFVSGEEKETCPEPDVTALRDYPRHLPRAKRRWQDQTPVLVVEVLSDNPEKDLERNVDLYLRVPSIREYWVFDIRANPDQPTLRVHRRYGKRWVVRDLNFGDTYTTRTLPGFELLIDPDAETA
jgi:Uma2 family endonuclease